MFTFFTLLLQYICLDFHTGRYHRTASLTLSYIFFSWKRINKRVTCALHDYSIYNLLLTQTCKVLPICCDYCNLVICFVSSWFTLKLILFVIYQRIQCYLYRLYRRYFYFRTWLCNSFWSESIKLLCRIVAN